MNRGAIRTITGLLLITVGVVFLLQAVGVISIGLALVWAAMFAAGGIAFLYFYTLNQEQWWALIPGFSLLGIGGVIAVAEYGPAELENVAGGIFLLSIGLGFLVIFLRNREMWWPLIPLGFCVTLGIMVILDPFVKNGDLMGALFFLGGALTFGLLGFFPAAKGKMSWAFIPAAVMLAMGGVILASAYGGFQIFGATALILMGVFLLLRSLQSRERA